ncbi:unnamed protein product, partial [Callosobruchus maculatus]
MGVAPWNTCCNLKAASSLVSDIFVSFGVSCVIFMDSFLFT